MEKNFYKKIKKVFYLCLIILLFSIFARNLVFAQGNPTGGSTTQNYTTTDSSSPSCPPGQILVNGECITPDPIGQPGTPIYTYDVTDENANTDTNQQTCEEGDENCVELTNTDTTTDDSRTVYKLLAPLKSSSGTIDSFDTAKDCAFGDYLNIMIDIFIGIAAVLAMLMIVIGGIEYMTSELVSSKESGKSKITQAVLGLLLVLAAWLILNTLNPKLLSLCLNKLPKGTPVVIQDFKVSGGLKSTFNGQPIKVNFNKEAYPAAQCASKKTGVSAAFILAIFSQETGSGANTGGCNYANANMGAGQLEALKKLFPNNWQSINMSCAAGASTHGGAIGYTQFLPATWLQYKNQAVAILGHEPNPWNTGDALMMSALYLKSVGGASNEKEAACKYFAGPGNSCSTNSGINTYGDGVMGRKLSLQKQIDQAIADGKIDPNASCK